VCNDEILLKEKVFGILIIKVDICDIPHFHAARGVTSY